MTTTVIQDIIIDHEYASLAPEMSDSEFEALKQSISEHGQQVSITTNTEGVLLDGHNRYRASNELGIKPNTEIKTFQDRVHEKLFVIICAQNRRNLTEGQKAVLALKKLEVLKEIGETHHQATLPKKGQKGFQPVSPPIGGHIGDSAKAAAKDAGIGHGTLRRVKKVMEDGSEEQKQDLLRGISPNKLHNQVIDEENKNHVKEKLEAGQELTDQEILLDLGIKFNPVTVWTFQRRNTSFGCEYPGNTPPQLVARMLYWFTKQGDLIVDPMAGGGVVGDVSAIMKRKCKMYDVKPHKERNDIEKFDITKGFPKIIESIDLIFWDPPYYKKKEKEYGLQSISALPREEYLNVFRKSAKEWHDLGNIKRVALLMSDYEGYTDSKDSVFVWDYVDIFRAAGWQATQHIHCPLSTEQMNGAAVLTCRERHELYGLSRSLVIFENTAASQPEKEMSA